MNNYRFLLLFVTLCVLLGACWAQQTPNNCLGIQLSVEKVVFGSPLDNTDMTSIFNYAALFLSPTNTWLLSGSVSLNISAPTFVKCENQNSGGCQTVAFSLWGEWSFNQGSNDNVTLAFVGCQALSSIGLNYSGFCNVIWTPETTAFLMSTMDSCGGVEVWSLNTFGETLQAIYLPSFPGDTTGSDALIKS